MPAEPVLANAATDFIKEVLKRYTMGNPPPDAATAVAIFGLGAVLMGAITGAGYGIGAWDRRQARKFQEKHPGDLLCSDPKCKPCVARRAWEAKHGPAFCKDDKCAYCKSCQPQEPRKPFWVKDSTDPTYEGPREAV